MKKFFIIFLMLLLLPSAVLAGGGKDDAYPFQDPYVATVIGTPRELSYVPSRKARPLPQVIQIDERVAPPLFWHSDYLRYSVLFQKKTAPLIFLIAGTGAGYNAPKMAYLQQVFYAAGYHVIALSSPTHPNFIVSASTSRAPGYIRDDVKDLYRVMDLIVRQQEIRERVDGFYVAGYSLGAAQSAFLMKLDDEERVFAFRKALMINPPVSLLSSAARLDQLLKEGDETPEAVEDLASRFIAIVAEYYKHQDHVQFDGDFLYRLYRYHRVPHEDLKKLVGVSFRMSAANIIFSTDVCLNTGYIVPDGKILTVSDSLRPYMLTAVKLGFEQYFEEFLAPYLQYRDPTLTPERLVAESSLESIAPYLRANTKIEMLTNADDPILSPEELAFLEKTFAGRAVIYPTGGHCGNIMYKQTVEDMLRLVHRQEIKE
ncbi:alpha/beta fold hydrolase [Desulfobaculum bizertense]|uniref:alpha/beta fold hydrolase n=1 Tax=Desulfobaculum bizertense TaxID=376490 RepID=UPI001F33669C|nr:alpha/beta fold hydrolase [Desulfobaculum bizertense]UIJ39200.1 alpha/beta fold hydrolase [Desulfobaculum bizertense]